MSTVPTIGVAMPARNASRYIGEALTSITGQSHSVADIVVVDDGSDDDTAVFATQFAPLVRVIRQPPTGPAAARNRGIRELHTDFVALLDADDVWPIDSLAVRAAALRADTTADLCFGRMSQFVSPELPEAEQRRLYVDPKPLAAWTSSGMLARRGVFERFGYLAEDRRAGDFLEWLLGARAGGARVVTVDDVVVRRRLHLENLTRREPQENANYLAVVRAELARRRSEAAS